MTSKSPTKVVKFSLRPIQEIHIDSAPTLPLAIFCIYLQNFVDLQPLTNYITMFMGNNIVSAMRAFAAAAANQVHLDHSIDDLGKMTHRV